MRELLAVSIDQLQWMEEMIVITEEQLAFFQAFGFLVLPQAFSPQEMDAISQEFDDMLVAERLGQPFPGEKRQSLYGIAESSALLTDMVADDRIYKTVESLLGEGFLWLCSEGNLYVDDTQWHPDGTRLDFRPMKVSLYLDHLTAETGCLRLIPGSHHLPFHEDLKPVSKFELPGPEVPCFPFESQPGDLCFVDMNLWHASFGGRSGRRHLAVNFVPEAKTAAHTTTMAQNHQGVLGGIEKHQYSQPQRVFSDSFLYSDNPRIRRMSAKWVELGLP